MNPQDKTVSGDDQPSGNSQPLSGYGQNVDQNLANEETAKPAETPDYVLQASVPLENDQVELAWVDRAKAIIQSYSSDPNRMTKELEKLRIEYMQKQHNKTLQSNEDRSA